MAKSILGDRIRLRRKELRLTQTQLAELTGYSDKTAISRIESGENDLTRSKVIIFAQALRTTPSYLMGWVEEPSPKKIPSPKGKTIQAAYDLADEETQKAVRNLLGME